MMARPCSVCSYKDREKVDRALVRGESYLSISRWSGLSDSALSRHMRHLLTELAEAKAARDITIDNVMQDLLDLRRQVLDICAEARAEKNNDQALRAIGRATKLLEVRAEILGQIKKEGATVNVQVNLLQLPEWAAFKHVLFTALMPFKEARIAVAKAMMIEERKLEAKADVAS